MALATAGREKVLSSYDLYTNIGKLTEVFERHGLSSVEGRALEVAS
jgi:hypothetical protein